MVRRNRARSLREVALWRTRCRRGRRRFAAVAALAVAGVAAPAHAADDAAAFYQGKQVRFFTMGSPGGGYDTYTRTVGAFLEKKLGAR